jgi:hypothetical protein
MTTSRALLLACPQQGSLVGHGEKPLLLLCLPFSYVGHQQQLLLSASSLLVLVYTARGFSCMIFICSLFGIMYICI